MTFHGLPLIAAGIGGAVSALALVLLFLLKIRYPERRVPGIMLFYEAAPTPLHRTLGRRFAHRLHFLLLLTLLLLLNFALTRPTLAAAGGRVLLAAASEKREELARLADRHPAKFVAAAAAPLPVALAGLEQLRRPGDRIAVLSASTIPFRPAGAGRTLPETATPLPVRETPLRLQVPPETGIPRAFLAALPELEVVDEEAAEFRLTPELARLWRPAVPERFTAALLAAAAPLRHPADRQQGAELPPELLPTPHRYELTLPLLGLVALLAALDLFLYQRRKVA